MTKFIAERKLLYSLKNSPTRKEFVIRIGAPYLLKEGMVNFSFDEGVSGCLREVHGINEDGFQEEKYIAYGADSLQALQIASNIEPFLKRLSKKFDFYFLDGQPYFED